MESTAVSYLTTTAAALETQVTISHPNLSSQGVLEVIDKWVKKQGKNWPSELNAAYLASTTRLVFLPHWVVNASGSANWSASIGYDYFEPQTCGRCFGRGIVDASQNSPLGSSSTKERCTRCGGSGKEQIRKTRYVSQGGYINGTVNGQIVDNWDGNLFKLRIKKRDFNAAEETVSKAQLTEQLIIPPKETSKLAGNAQAKFSLQKQLESNAHDVASGMGPVRDLQVVNVQADSLGARIWLYPIFVGAYSYLDEQEIEIQIDAVTGEIRAEVPKVIKKKRLKNLLRFFVMCVAMFIVIMVILSIAIESYRPSSFRSMNDPSQQQTHVEADRALSTLVTPAAGQPAIVEVVAMETSTPTPQPSRTPIPVTQRPTRTLVPPTPTSTQLPVLFSEDFEDRTSQIGISGFNIRADRDGNHAYCGSYASDLVEDIFIIPDDLERNIHISIRIKITEASDEGGVGVLARYWPENEALRSGYGIALLASGPELASFRASDTRVWHTWNSSLQENRWYTIQMEKDGFQISGSIDGQRSGLYSPHNLTGSTVTLIAHNSTVCFDDIVIRQLR